MNTEGCPLDISKAALYHAYGSSKTYVHSVGLSSCFRQWRARSHCRFLHGYALKVHIEFEATTLDERNWVADFGALKPIKEWLEETFDHKTLVAEDDPDLNLFKMLAARRMSQHIPLNPDMIATLTSELPLIQLVVLPSVGVESFARIIFEWVNTYLRSGFHGSHDRSIGFGHVTLKRVTVSEHEGNSAWYGRVGRDASVSPADVRRIVAEALNNTGGTSSGFTKAASVPITDFRD